MRRVELAADGVLLFQCPACGCGHGAPLQPNGPWVWNGNEERPTIRPSLRYTGMCHCFVTDGQIQILEHVKPEFAGKTLPLPDVDE